MKRFESITTRITSTKLRKKWDIENFVELCEDDAFDIYSGWFPQKEKKGEHWRIHIHSDKLSSIIKFRLKTDGNTTTPWLAAIVTIIDSEYKFSRFNEYKFDLPRKQFLNNNNLQNGTLTLVCEVFSDIQYVNESKGFDIPTCKLTLSRDFISLIMNDDMSDIVLVINGQELKTNKVILAGCSKVFKAMLQNDMLEAKTGRIEIKQVEYSVMEELVRFAHTGQISPNIHGKEELLTSLLETADKYDIMDLKLMSEDYLSQCLTKKNVADLLSVAELLHAESLKIKCLDFIGSGLVGLELLPESTLIRKVNILWTIFFPHFACLKPIYPQIGYTEFNWLKEYKIEVNLKEQWNIWLVNPNLKKILHIDQNRYNVAHLERFIKDEGLKNKCVTFLFEYIETEEQAPGTTHCHQLGLTLFQSPDLKDLTIPTAGQGVQVHQAIIAIRCPALLENNKMLEHVDMDIAQLIIQHVYTGEINSSQFADKELVIMTVARDLALWRLHAFCCNILCSKVTSENAAVMLLSALEHHANDDLIEYIKLCIRRSFVQVQETEEWQMNKDKLLKLLLSEPPEP